MAHALMPSCLAFCAALAVAGAMAAPAEMLPDPTRPPAMLLAPTVPADGESDGGLVLQSVLIAPHHRAAVIGGNLVQQGGRVRGYTLTQVTETEVTLAGAGGRRTLKLFPGIQKKLVQASSEVPDPRGRSREASSTGRSKP
ncbi:MAG: hypothetical protein KIT73_05920 [Burkholderiales bacterium]|nr:hypothetical protein [Burkholderiales bacterium]